jgi:hypothetical protein
LFQWQLCHASNPLENSFVSCDAIRRQLLHLCVFLIHVVFNMSCQYAITFRAHQSIKHKWENVLNWSQYVNSISQIVGGYNFNATSPAPPVDLHLLCWLECAGGSMMTSILFFRCHSLGLKAQSDASREVFLTRMTWGFI